MVAEHGIFGPDPPDEAHPRHPSERAEISYRKEEYRQMKCKVCGVPTSDLGEFDYYPLAGVSHMDCLNMRRAVRTDGFRVAHYSHKHKDEVRELNYGPQWNEIRKQVIERDGEKCRHCGMTREEHINEFSKDLNVHHKIPFREFDKREMANRKSNLITLCLRCHKKEENRIQNS